MSKVSILVKKAHETLYIVFYCDVTSIVSSPSQSEREGSSHNSKQANLELRATRKHSLSPTCTSISESHYLDYKACFEKGNADCYCQFLFALTLISPLKALTHLRQKIQVTINVLVLSNPQPIHFHCWT